MQSFEEEMKSLRRAIRHILDRIGWRRAVASEPPAPEPESAPDRVSSILDRTAADLRQLSMSGDDDFDAGPIIDRAVRELGELGFQSPPVEDELMERYLAELPEPDYRILCLFKEGRKHIEIAEIMNTDLQSVRESLIKTYADLRMRMTDNDSDGGGGLPADLPSHSTSPQKPMKRTLLHHL